MTITQPSPIEHSEIPRRQIVAAIVVQDEKVLMVHNIKHGLRIEPTGGKIHDGETPEQAALREAREELDIEIELVEKLGIASIHTPEGEFDNHLFLARIISGSPTIPEAEKKKLGGFRWYSIQELRSLPELVPEVREALEEIERRMA